QPLLFQRYVRRLSPNRVSDLRFLLPSLVQLELDWKDKSHEYRFSILFSRLPRRHHRYHAHSFFVAVRADSSDCFHFANTTVFAHNEADINGTINTHTARTRRIPHILL